MKVRDGCRTVELGSSDLKSAARGKVNGSYASGSPALGGCGLHVCSQACVTARSRAASREAKAFSSWNTRQGLPLLRDRWTEKEARKRPQSVGCVEGETTNLPMEMPIFEI